MERIDTVGYEDRYGELLSKIQGKDEAFVTFTDQESSRFIQFASRDSSQFLADIPTNEMNSDQPTLEEIEKYFPEFEAEQEYPPDHYTKICGLNEAIEATDMFFSDVCGLRSGFGLEVNLHLGEVECLICEGKFRNTELNIVSAQAAKLRQAGVSEEAIEKEMEIMSNIHKHELASEGIYEDSELENAARKMARDLLFVTVCSGCSKNV